MNEPNQPANTKPLLVELPDSESVTIPVIEERVNVSKELVETGRVRLTKHVDTEQITVDVPLLHEETQVERIPMNEYVETAPPVRYEGDTMIVSVVREEVVINKRLVLVEELRVTKQQVTTVVSQPVALRQETVSVERISSGPMISTPSSDL